MLDPGNRIIAALLPVEVEKCRRLFRRHLPFHHSSGQVPGNVSWPGEKVIVAVAAGIGLQHMATGGEKPFVWLHLAVGDRWAP